MNNGPYVIGQKPPGTRPLDLELEIGVNEQAGTVVVAMVLLKVDRRHADISPQDAIKVMQTLGMAVETLCPGTLIGGIKQWLAELEAAKAKAKEVLADLGVKR
jgi:hypothetical protein